VTNSPKRYSIVLAVLIHNGDAMEAAIEWIRATNAQGTWCRRPFFYAGYWCNQIEVDTWSQRERIELYANLCNIENHASSGKFEVAHPGRGRPDISPIAYEE